MKCTITMLFSVLLVFVLWAVMIPYQTAAEGELEIFIF